MSVNLNTYFLYVLAHILPLLPRHYTFESRTPEAPAPYLPIGGYLQTCPAQSHFGPVPPPGDGAAGAGGGDVPRVPPRPPLVRGRGSGLRPGGPTIRRPPSPPIVRKLQYRKLSPIKHVGIQISDVFDPK